MPYQALYRKYRPRTFDDVSGQEHVTETLKRQIVNGRLSHAYLFVGTRGTGKTSCAKILSKAINCENPVDGSPCNKCPSCLGIDSGSILDVAELDAASNNGVDNIRALRDEAVFTPASVKKRVYIIDEVHMLSGSAFNALLKILEEPPEHLVFILATTEIRKVPATILSRCQRFTFKRLSVEAIKNRLIYVSEKEHISLSDDAASLLSRLADGSMRDALSLLDQCSAGAEITAEGVLQSMGLAGALETIALYRDIKNSDTLAALDRFSRLYSSGKDPTSLLSELMDLYRDILITKISPDASGELLSGSVAGRDELISLGKGISARELLGRISLMQEAVSKSASTSDKKTAAEVCLIELCSPEAESSAPTYTERPAAPKSAPAVFEKPAPAAKSQKPAETFTPIWEDIPKKPQTGEKTPDDFIPPWEDAPAEKSAPEKAKQEDDAASFSREDISRPASQSAEIPASGAGGWQDILKELESTLSKPVLMFLSGDVHSKAVIGENMLTINAMNDFVLGMLDTTEIKVAVKNAADKVLGRPVSVTVTSRQSTPQPKRDKLDELGRFSNIKFE